MSPAALDYGRLFEALPSAYVVITTDFAIVSVNQAYADVALIQRDAVLGKWLSDVFPDNPRHPGEQGFAKLRPALESVLHTGEPASLPVLRYDLQGKEEEFLEKYWSVVCTPIQGVDGEVAFIVVRVQDVTELVYARRKGHEQQQAADALRMRLEQRESDLFLLATELRQANEELERQQQQKDRFIAMLSHELRNPLASIRAAKDLLSLDNPDHPAVKVLDRQSAALTRLTDDLLATAQVIRGRLPLFPRILDLRDLVRDTVRDIKATRPNDFRLTSPELPEEPLLVDGDPVRLGQALVNLVDNAHRYAGPDATITVSLRHMDEGWAELAVADDGIGFDPTHASALFEPYMQDALPDSTQGLGLGLVVVRSIVELHGGTATAQSEGPGKGACFYLRLPVATDAAVEAQQPPPAPRRAPRSLETLFIDDNEDLAVTYKTLLSRRGDKVWIAFTGEEGLAMAEATRFQLVLCDLALGEGMDGYALASELRASQYPAKLVAISGFTETEDHERALAAGFDALLAKPLNLKELDRLVDRWSLR